MIGVKRSVRPVHAGRWVCCEENEQPNSVCTVAFNHFLGRDGVAQRLAHFGGARAKFTVAVGAGLTLMDGRKGNATRLAEGRRLVDHALAKQFVERFINVHQTKVAKRFGHEAGIDEVLAIAQTHDDVWASVGMHPQSVQQEYAWIEEKLLTPGVVAVGETGLDYKTADSAEEHRMQLQAFEHQMDLAERFDLPVVIHTRDAQSDTLKMLENFPKVRGVLHCFTESWEMAERAIELGYFISISGIVTFAKAENVRAVAEKVPLDRLLIETDAPWLAPVPHRGKVNQPAYVTDVAKCVADVKGITLEEVARVTTENFYKLFKAS